MRPPPFRLGLVAARAAFESHIQWLDAIEQLARSAPAAEEPPVAFIVRIEPIWAREAGALAAAAIERLRCHDGAARTIAVLNGPEPAHAALDMGYDGVHWPESRIPATGEPPVRGYLRGASIHSLAALRTAECAAADYALFGPVWAPSWKPARPAGLAALREITADATIPVLAIGGVTPDRIAPCLDAGAAGVAVVSGIFHAADPNHALSRYRAAFAAES